TRKTEPSVGAQCTSTIRARWVSFRCARFTQSARCTETPCPWVTNPLIWSPGTGVQHRDRRTHTSGAPVTSTPEPEGAGGLGALVGSVVSASSSSAPASPPTERTSFSTTDWALTRPSPTAAYSPDTSG